MKKIIQMVSCLIFLSLSNCVYAHPEKFTITNASKIDVSVSQEQPLIKEKIQPNQKIDITPRINKDSRLQFHYLHYFEAINMKDIVGSLLLDYLSFLYIDFIWKTKGFGPELKAKPSWSVYIEGNPSYDYAQQIESFLSKYKNNITIFETRLTDHLFNQNFYKKTLGSINTMKNSFSRIASSTPRFLQAVKKNMNTQVAYYVNINTIVTDLAKLLINIKASFKDVKKSIKNLASISVHEPKRFETEKTNIVWEISFLKKGTSNDIDKAKELLDRLQQAVQDKIDKNILQKLLIKKMQEFNQAKNKKLKDLEDLNKQLEQIK